MKVVEWVNEERKSRRVINPNDFKIMLKSLVLNHSGKKMTKFDPDFRDFMIWCGFNIDSKLFMWREGPYPTNFFYLNEYETRKRNDYQIWKSEDLILRIYPVDPSKPRFSNNTMKAEFETAMKNQSRVYECTKKHAQPFTSRVYVYGPNWVIMEKVRGVPIKDLSVKDKQDCVRLYIEALRIIHKYCKIVHLSADEDNAIYDKVTKRLTIMGWGSSSNITTQNLTKEALYAKYKKHMSKYFPTKEELYAKYKNSVPKQMIENMAARTLESWLKNLRRFPITSYSMEILPYNSKIANIYNSPNILKAIQRVLNSNQLLPAYTNANKANIASNVNYNRKQVLQNLKNEMAENNAKKYGKGIIGWGKKKVSKMFKRG